MLFKAFFISVLSLSFSLSQAAVCSEATSLKYASNTGRLVEMSVSVDKKTYSLQNTSSQKLFEIAESHIKGLKLGDQPEFFVCLDKFSELSKDVLKVEQFRLWDRRKFLARFPTPATMKDIADYMGEYFSIDELDTFAENAMFEYKVIPKQQLKKFNANLNRYVELAIENRNWELDPKGHVYDYEVYVITDLNGAILGYIISIADSIDHPLWDGSGVTIYLDELLGKVAEEEWTG